MQEALRQAETAGGCGGARFKDAPRTGPARVASAAYRRAQKSVTASRGPRTSKVSFGRNTVSDWTSDTKA